MLGLDARRLCAEANVPEQAVESGARVPEHVRRRLLTSACRAAKRHEFALEVGLALPFGAFGLMDYLAASADTLGDSCEALSRHFDGVSCDHDLEIESSDGEYRLELVTGEARADSPEPGDFVLGALLGRLRGRVAKFSLAGVRLRRARPAAAARFEELLGAPASFGHATSTLCLPAHLRVAPLSSADPWLRRTLESLLPAAGGSAGGSALERSLRGCLRDLLPERKFGAARVASALGMSERSLHRRLRERGQSYQGLVDGFRREEAERLLLDGRVDMAEIAHRLGFADQSAFSRAFRRWTRLPPRAWLAFASR